MYEELSKDIGIYCDQWRVINLQGSPLLYVVASVYTNPERTREIVFNVIGRSAVSY